MTKPIPTIISPLLILALVTSGLAESAPPESTGWRLSKDNSPGVVLELKETGRKTLRDGTPEVTYSVHASGFPEAKTYSLWMHRLEEEPVKVINKMVVDETGEMMVSEFAVGADVPWLPAPLATALPISLVKFQPAEPVFVSAIADDNTIEGHAIGFPLPVEDRDGSCHLYLEMIDRRRTAFAAWGQGFEPGETVTTESRSGKEVLQSTLVIGSAGGFINVLMPQTARKKRGTASFSVAAQTCSVHIEYEWGRKKKR